MSKIVELSIGELENVVGGVTMAASASRYPAPTNTTSSNKIPSGNTSSNQAPPPPRQRTF